MSRALSVTLCASAVVCLAAGSAMAAPAPTAAGSDIDAPTPSQADAPTPDASTPDAPAPDAKPVAAPAETPAPTPPAATAVDGPAVLDAVLPCGLHVVVGRDTTLPVAGIVLAVETGTEDDPGNQPGLVHALAYQLLQGNRELAPGAAAALVHDGGGVTTLAIGPAQVRYESLVPASRLEAALWAEAQRLRAPTVSEVLWADALRWARRDKARKWSAPRTAIAAAHDAPGFEHDGRGVGPELTGMSMQAVAQALAKRFTYDRATLTVVGPGSLQETWTLVADAFDDLPDAPRTLPGRLTKVGVAPTGTQPRPLAVDKPKGAMFLWPVAPTPAAQLEATVWCKAINRQRRVEGDGARARVRCSLDLDPRRSTMVLRASGVPDPQALVRERIARLLDGTDDALIEKQRQIVLANDRVAMRTPIALARRLSEDASIGATAQTPAALRAVSDAAGHGPLIAGESSPMRFGDQWTLAAAVAVVPQAPEGS